MARTATTSKLRQATGDWRIVAPAFGPEPGHRASIGVIALGTDRVGEVDTRDFLSGIDGVAMFTTRVPMAETATPESLAAMGPHLEEAARRIVTGAKLGAIGFSCTSGTVAIGCANVRNSIRRARPGTPVTTPMEAGAEALKKLGAKRITLLVPYLPRTADLVAGFFEEHGFEIVRRATFNLDGDPDMNRLSADCLVETGAAVFDPASDALFLSCTGLATFDVVARLEARIDKPVVTSNQALAWASLRAAGVNDKLEGRGVLLEKL
jgi:maleate isomerase